MSIKEQGVSYQKRRAGDHKCLKVESSQDVRWTVSTFKIGAWPFTVKKLAAQVGFCKRRSAEKCCFWAWL